VKIAAVDIGSNAIRLFVAEVFYDAGKIELDKISHTRIPIRLGEDVFTFGRISEKKQLQLTQTLSGLSLIIQSLDVEQYRICATSAMRSAENGREVVNSIKLKTGLVIDVLSGAEEADIIFANFEQQELPKSKNYLFIDVGGGSTELTIIENFERKHSQSFEIGTVRMLINDQEKIPKAISIWLKENLNSNLNYEAIATGGNISSAFKMLEKKQREPIAVKELETLLRTLSKLTPHERVKKYSIRPDRADVIVPALNLYTQVANSANIEKIFAPKFGLADGIVLKIFKSI
jgi:exopolyphosphatase/guanosine-5'-triphosphate,3'-diphosphate pyrophosphatase